MLFLISPNDCSVFQSKQRIVQAFQLKILSCCGTQSNVTGAFKIFWVNFKSSGELTYRNPTKEAKPPVVLGALNVLACDQQGWRRPSWTSLMTAQAHNENVHYHGFCVCCQSRSRAKYLCRHSEMMVLLLQILYSQNLKFFFLFFISSHPPILKLLYLCDRIKNLGYKVGIEQWMSLIEKKVATNAIFSKRNTEKR